MSRTAFLVWRHNQLGDKGKRLRPLPTFFGLYSRSFDGISWRLLHLSWIYFRFTFILAISSRILGLLFNHSHPKLRFWARAFLGYSRGEKRHECSRRRSSN